MREKIVQFFVGLIIYSIFGVIIVWVSGDGFKGQWPFIIIWTVGMSLMHVFFIEPFRARQAKKRAAQKKNK